MTLTSVRLYPHSTDLIEAQAEDGSICVFWVDDRGQPHRVVPVLHAVDGRTVETLMVNDGIHVIQLPLRVRIIE